jgi:hypothetical protein
MRTFGLVLLLSLSLACPAASAQTNDHESTAELPAMPRAPVHVEQRFLTDPTPGRAIVTWLIGAAGWLGLAGMTTLALHGATAMCPDDECARNATFGMGGLLAAAGLVVVPVTAWGLGRHLDGKGDLGWTMLGHFLGALSWSFVALAAALDADPEIVIGTGVFAGVAQVTGAALAFELSSSDNREEERRAIDW